MGKASMEPRIIDEVEQYIEHFIQPRLNTPLSLDNSLHEATSNIISQMLFSRRFDYGDRNQNMTIKAIDDMFKLLAQTALVENLPFGGYLSRKLRERERTLNLEVLLPILQTYIDENKKTMDREHPRNFIDRYLIHSATNEGKDESIFSGKRGYLSVIVIN